MALRDCLQYGFQCKETIDGKEASAEKKLHDSIDKLNTEQDRLEELTASEQEVKFAVEDLEHYTMLYGQIDVPWDKFVKRDIDIRTKIKQHFGESPTQFVPTDPSRVEYKDTGLHNYRPPKDFFISIILGRYPLKLYTTEVGYLDNHALRFWAETDMGMFWNITLAAVRTKTRWVNMTWFAEEDSLSYCDPLTKQVWTPSKTSAEDNPEVILI